MTIEPRVGDFLDSLQPIASELGPALVVDLVKHFAGSRLYVPARWRDDLKLNAVGEERARRLCEMFGPERIDIPRIPWTPAAIRRFARELADRKLTASEIAREIGISYRTIERALSGTPVLTGRRRRPTDERQIDLVDWLARGGS